MIRMLVPGWQRVRPGVARRDLGHHRQRDRVLPEAAATSSTRTAYPSMAELSNDGSALAAATSSASTRPWTSPRLSSVGASGTIVPSISAR